MSRELIDDLIVTGADVVDHAGLDVLREQFLVEGIECRLDGADLCEDIDAVAVLLDHLADAADLALNAPQARDKAFVLLAVLVTVFMFDAAAAGLFFCTFRTCRSHVLVFSHAHMKYTPNGILYYTIRGYLSSKKIPARWRESDGVSLCPSSG